MDETTTLVPLAPDQGERGFDVVLRGYDRAQVDRHLDYLEGLLHGAAKRAEALEHELAQERERPVPPPADPPWDALGRRVTEILALADQEAAEIRHRAHEDVASLEERVRAREGEVEAACAQREQAATEQADRIRQEAEAEARQLRAAAREAADQAVAQARAEAERALVEAGEQAEQLRRSARDDAEGMRRLAEEDVLRLARRRDTIRHDLESLHQRLASVMSGADRT